MAEALGGGYDYTFISEQLEDYICTICNFIFKNPQQIEGCGHIFCKTCFNKMKEHAQINRTQLICPIDREKILRVFTDNATERRVLNLKVKCPNFGEDCTRTGELKSIMEHEKKCQKNNSGTDISKFVLQLKQLESRTHKLEEKLGEKDKQIKSLNEQMQNLVQQRTNNTTSMIIPNIEDDSNFSLMSAVFEWKFNVEEVRNGILVESPPFYNITNTNCFQLDANFDFELNVLQIRLFRYRGKYDHPLLEVTDTDQFTLEVNIYGINGKHKLLRYSDNDFTIDHSSDYSSHGFPKYINNGEINSFTIDGFVHMRCTFN